MACTVGRLACLLTAAAMTSAFRVRSKSRSKDAGLVKSAANASASSSVGVVDKLYTWGAPAPTDRKFLRDARKRNGCWDGLRIVNLRTATSTGIWDVDVVTGICNFVGYWHTNQPTALMDENGKVYNYPCGSDPNLGFTIPAASIHGPTKYDSRADTLSGEAKLMTKLCVLPSYRVYPYAARTIRPYGWNLVGTALWDGKETHLMQHPVSLQCVLTFQGTAPSRVLDWWDNLRFWSGSYCGLEDSVHAGFRDQLRAVVENGQYQANIKPKLPKCSSLIVAGHSLGGALAAVFSACVNAAPGGNADYENIMWTKQTPKKMAPIA